jgi:hypothetical protein
MSKPWVLSIDDDEEEVTPNVDPKQFELVVVSPEDEDLSGKLLSHLEKASLILLDQKFNTQPAPLSLIAPDGASFVSHLRSWARSTDKFLPPIVLFTNDSEAFRHEIPAIGAALPLNGSFVGREHLLAPALDVEWIQHKAEDSTKTRIEQLIWASVAVHQAAGNDGASLKDIEKLLVLPKGVKWIDRAQEEIRNARPPVNQTETGAPEEPRGSSYIVRWLCHRALPFPGLFLSDLYAAWAIGISLKKFRAIADCKPDTEWLLALSGAKYVGPLDEFLGRRWWRAGIDHMVYMLDSASTKQRPRKDVFSTFVPHVKIEEIRPPSSHVVTWTPGFTESKIEPLEKSVQLRPPGWPAEALEPWVAKSDIENDEVLQAMIEAADLP